MPGAWKIFALSTPWMLIVAALVLSSGCESGKLVGAKAAAGMQSQALLAGWSFYRYEPDEKFDRLALPTEGWSEVILPHTARVEPRIVNAQWQGDALYRRNLFAESAWAGKAVWLRFEGAMMVARVYVNGIEVLEHKGGYLPFTADLSNKLVFGQDNDILVHLDNRDNPITGPKPLPILDFNMYGGLYREVRLFVADSLHITDEMLAGKVAGGGVFVTFPEVSRERAQVLVKTQIENTGQQARQFTVRHVLKDGQADLVTMDSDAMTLSPSSQMEQAARLTVIEPALWSPRAPHLYKLVTEIVSAGEVVDRRETQIGIRRIAISKGEFSINGEPMFLRGVNRHQEYPYIGYAISPEADYRDAKLIKEAGFDYVRLSHYPHSRHFMRAADELGLVVLDAILGWQFFNSDPAFSEQVLQTCRDLIRRDRNHPSVIAWECSLNESAMPPALIEALNKVVHEEYPGDQAYSAGWTPEGYDIFMQARQHRLQHYAEPDRPYLVSEYGDWEYYAQNAGLNQDAWADLAEDERTSRQLLGSGERRLLQQATNIQEAHNDNFRTPAFGDGYWAMFDYNRGYADDLEASGIMSIDRVAKPSFHFFRSQRDAEELSDKYTSGPMAEIASYWTAASSTDVRVYSNAEEVELLLNGDVVGRKGPDENNLSDNLAHPPFTFSLPAFRPGALEAIGYIGGREAVRTSVRTPGEVQGLRLELATHGVPLGKNDLVFLRAGLHDGQNVLVPESGVTVNFGVDCKGPGADLAGPTTATTEAGIASVLLRVMDPAASCVMTARSGSFEQSIPL